MYAKKYPLDVRIDPRIIEEGKIASSKANVPFQEAVLSLPNFVQYPYTNEDSEKLRKAFNLRTKNGNPLIRGKRNLLFVIGGGALISSFEDIFNNNKLDTITGIDLSSAQCLNMKYLLERAAKEETRGISSFLRRAPKSSNTETNSMRVSYPKQEISEKIFGYPLTVEPDNKARSYFSVPARGLYNERKTINLRKGDIIDYLRSVEAQRAPDLIYTSNLSEWANGSIYNTILGIVEKGEKFPVGTIIIGSHRGGVIISRKEIKDGKPTMQTYELNV